MHTIILTCNVYIFLTAPNDRVVLALSTGSPVEEQTQRNLLCGIEVCIPGQRYPSVTLTWVNLLELVVEVSGESGEVCWDSVCSKQVGRG